MSIESFRIEFDQRAITFLKVRLRATRWPDAVTTGWSYGTLHARSGRYRRGAQQELGYERFVAAGTDIGSDIATHLALRYSAHVRGIHVNAVA